LLRAFYYPGAKGTILTDILQILENVPHRHYCEPFGGSAVVLLNKRPAEIETLNDLDGEVVNFFRVLRDRPEELIRAVDLTPYSRQEYLSAIQQNGEISDLERAWRFFVRACQSYGGTGAQKPTRGRWAYSVTGRWTDTGAAKYRRVVENLYAVAKRLQRVQIECDDAVAVIRRYDSPETLFYVDPPYPLESRVDDRIYALELTDERHAELAEVLAGVKGKAALSTYDCPLVRRLYPRDRWEWHSISSRSNISRKRPGRAEVVITNFRFANSLRKEKTSLVVILLNRSSTRGVPLNAWLL